MRETDMTGETCVGELRLSSLDVGFDLRLGGGTVEIPDKFRSVGINRDGRVWLIEGTREEMIAAIRAAGYRVTEPKPSKRKRSRNKPKPKPKCGSL